LTGTFVDLLLEFLEFAGDMSGVAIKYWGVLGADLTWVVKDDDLSSEGFGLLSWVFLAVGGNMATTDVLDGDVLDVEANVVTWTSLLKSFVMHLDGLDLSADAVGGEGGDASWLEDTGLNTADWDCADTANLVDVLEWETERFVGRTDWWGDGVEGLVEGLACVPRHVGGFLDHVVTVESGDWDEDDLGWVVADLLEVSADFFSDFVETLLAVGGFGDINLVDADEHLLDSEGEGEESVLTGLSVLSDTGLELTSSGGDDEDSDISLGGASDHVLDEITMAWGVDDRKAEFL